MCSFFLWFIQDNAVEKSLDDHGTEGHRNTLAIPPRRFGEEFKDVYDVILILDDREQFAKNNRGSDLLCTDHLLISLILACSSTFRVCFVFLYSLISYCPSDFGVSGW